MVAAKKSVSLVLGSGGARGMAHIGVIRWLEENDFEIKSISGCSIGALVGGVYAIGKLDEFETWIRVINKMDMAKLLDISWQSSGIFKGDKIINALVDLVGDQKIEDLPIPFTAVAADVSGEKEVWINSGKLFDAIRASISLPLLFTPFTIKGVELIDGGVLNPVPIAPTFGDNTDITIAVNLGGEIEIHPQTAKLAPVVKKSQPKVHDKINDFIASLQNSVKKSMNIKVGAFDIANQAFDAMQSTIARQKLAAYPPDKTIEIARNACGTLDFDRASELIELGYRKADESLRELKK